MVQDPEWNWGWYGALYILCFFIHEHPCDDVQWYISTERDEQQGLLVKQGNSNNALNKTHADVLSPRPPVMPTGRGRQAGAWAL